MAQRTTSLVLALFLTSLGHKLWATDTQPPWVSIAKPAANALVSGQITVSLMATDDVGVASVSLCVDGADVSPPVTTLPYIFPLNTRTLLNGVHSLLAIATDAAGNFAKSAIVSVSVSNPPPWKLSAGPLTITNLGCLLSVNTQERQTFFQLSNDVHLLLYYIANYGVSPIQLLDMNLSQGTSRLTNGAAPGRPGTRGAVLYTNGNIYQATSQANGKGYFFEYNPTTGASRLIAQATGSSPGQYDEIGDDGWIYIGGFPNAFVDRYNPVTDTYQRLGSMDTNADYAYTLGADSRYLYIGLGESPWSLGVYDTIAQTTNHYWITNADIYAAVRHGTNGGWYYQREGPTTTNVMVWYALSNGIPNAMTGQPKDLLVENAQRGNVVDGVNYGYLLGYQVNLDYAYPDSGSNAATIQWRTVGATGWRSATMTNFHLAPIGISRLYAQDRSNLLGFSSFYGPVWTYNIDSSHISDMGRPQFNLYDAAFASGVDYFCGYMGALLRWDPARRWTLVGSTTNFFNTDFNPYQTGLVIGKHEYFTTFGADGLVYVAALHERDSTGGELGWYDPLTQAYASLRTPFLDYGPNDLKPALGGTKLVYASSDTNLFVFDAATKSIERTITPLPGVVMDKVVEVSPGIMFGVAGSNTFEVNIADGSIIYSNTLPGRAFAESMTPPNHRLLLGPDGHVWMFCWYRDAQYFNRSSLYRINPADGSYSAIVTNTFYTYGENNVMFNGGDIYLYGGTNLYRMSTVLTSAGLTPASDLRITGH